MYKDFFSLKKKPFQISSDPAFMWFGEKHKEALATLKYGILDNKGFLLLTGDVGTGKTTLINALLQSLSDDVICVTVPDPGLEKMDFLNFIASAYNIPQAFTSKGAFLAHFRKFLLEADASKKKVLLIIDEAQLLTQQMLEEIRLLSNIEKMDSKLINIFFVGQNEFNGILSKEQNRAVRQRLTLNYNIDPLSLTETGEYIRHRLHMAGASHEIFDSTAIDEVFTYSGGFPRRINIICDHALLSGFVSEQRVITGEIIKECASELNIPASKTPHLSSEGVFQNQPVTAQNSMSQVPPTPADYKNTDAPDRIEQKSQQKSNKLWSFLSFFLFLIVLMFAWFYIFPSDYRFAVGYFKQTLSGVQNTLQPSLNHSLGNKDTAFFQQGQEESRALNERSSEDLLARDIKTSQTPRENLEIEGESAGASEPADYKSQDNPSQSISSSATIVKEIKPRQDVQSPSSDHLSEKLSAKKNEGGEPSGMSEVGETSFTPGPSKLLPPSPDASPVTIKPLPTETVIVRFKYNTNDFTPEGLEAMEEFSRLLISHPEAQVLITGYTDSAGYENYNVKLSEFRANIVRSFLLGKGVLSEQISATGRGSENPVESNDTSWGRMMNRRVEIKVADFSQ